MASGCLLFSRPLVSSQHDDDDNDDDDDDKSWFVDRSIRPIKGNFWAIFKKRIKKSFY